MEKKELIELINMIVDARRKEVAEQKIKPMSDSIDQLAPALSKLQAAVKTVMPNRINEYSKCTYADLVVILEEARPLFDEFGFSVVPVEDDYDGIKYLRTMLIHSSGQYISSLVEMIIQDTEKNKRLTPIQAYGSALSYHKRYSIANMLGITVSKDPNDDDGQPGGTQGQTQANKNNKDDMNTPKKEIFLSEGEIKFINDRVRGYEDVKKKLLTTLRKPSLDKCNKSMFDIIVEFVDSHIQAKKNNRLP